MDSLTFMKEAFEALVTRGVIDGSALTEVNIPDEEFEVFEKEFGVCVPEEVRSYLRAYGRSFRMLAAPVPDDLYCASPYNADVMKQICEMTPDEIAGIDEDDRFDLTVTWSDILNVDKEDPLKDLREATEGLRFFASQVKNPDIDEEKMKRFLPVGSWMSAGALCIDTSKKKEDVDLDDLSTWQIRWFDHEEFDWEEAGYIGEDGEVTGGIMFPDLEAFIKLYLYGAYDEAYLVQCEDWEEDPEDKSDWVQ